MIDVDVEDAAWTAALPDAVALLTRTAAASLQGRAIGDVTALLSDDETVRSLNARFRGKDSPTNVLSFPAAPSAKPHLGDIVLAFGVCASEAEAQGKSLRDHMMHLTAHGVLHLLGYDHQSDADAKVMEDLERDILAALGVADPYASELHPSDERDVPA